MTQVSRHYENDRIIREKVIQKLPKGYTVKEVEWDRGHKNGAEIHRILSNGVVEIYNKNTKILCTKIIATPNQIRRYFVNGQAPWWLIDRAIKNKAIKV